MNIADMNSIDMWSKHLGLLPVEMDMRNEKNQYLLLGGGSGDFCLDTDEDDVDQNERYVQSWSTNTKNYVCFKGDNILVYNWFSKSKDTYKKDIALSQLDNFYKLLASKSTRSADDIIPFVLNQFRRMRNLTHEVKNPVEALNLFYHLLISLDEDLNQLDCDKWRIKPTQLPAGFDIYVESLRNGARGDIRPNLDLMLRHCSGTLFQEAHQTATLFDRQYDLFGYISSDISFDKIKYSSLHYTPEYLARSIVESTLRELDLNKNEISILDPACGSGTFLLEVLHQLKKKKYSGVVRVTGWDSSESAIQSTDFLLNYENRTQWEVGKLSVDLSIVADSLEKDWKVGGGYDLILMNPPFLSWDLQSKQNRDLVSETLRNVVSNKPNQAAAFFYKATSALKPEGAIGSVLPYSVLQAESYQKLRNLIYENLDIKIAASLGNYIFESAIANTAVIVGKSKNKDRIIEPICVWCANKQDVAYDALRDLRKVQNREMSVCDKNTHSIYIPDRFPIIKDSWQIISYSSYEFMLDLEKNLSNGLLSKMGDVFSINDGVLTGRKNVFEISKEDYESFSLKEKKYFRQLLDNDTIKDGAINNEVRRYIWYPYDEEGKPYNEAEILNHSWLKTVLINHIDNLKGRKEVDAWWKLTRHRPVLAKAQQRIYSSRFGRSGSFAFGKRDYIIEEGNFMTLKNKPNEKDYLFYLAFFCSHTFDILLSIFAKQLKSGYDLGKTQIKNIPVPNVRFLENTPLYEQMVLIGSSITSGKSVSIYMIDDLLNDIYQNGKA